MDAFKGPGSRRPCWKGVSPSHFVLPQGCEPQGRPAGHRMRRGPKAPEPGPHLSKEGALSAFRVGSSCAGALVSKGLHSPLPRAPPNRTTIPKMLCEMDALTHFLCLEGWGRPSRFLPPPFFFFFARWHFFFFFLYGGLGGTLVALGFG